MSPLDLFNAVMVPLAVGAAILALVVAHHVAATIAMRRRHARQWAEIERQFGLDKLDQ